MNTDRIKAISQVGFQEGFTKVAHACGLEPHQLIKLAQDPVGGVSSPGAQAGMWGAAGGLGGALLGAGIGGVGSLAYHALTARPEDRNYLGALGKGVLGGGLVGGGLGALGGGAMGYHMNTGGRTALDKIQAGLDEMERSRSQVTNRSVKQ